MMKQRGSSLFIILVFILAGCNSASSGPPSPILPTPTPGSPTPTLATIAQEPSVTPVQAPVSELPTPSAKAVAYLNEALDDIQANSVMRDKMDWSAVRKAVLGPDLHAQTPSDTYPLIRNVLRELGDHHSQFLEPEQAKFDQEQASGTQLSILSVLYSDRVIRSVEAGSPAANAGAKPGDIIEKLNGDDASIIGASAFYTGLYEWRHPELELMRAGISRPVSATFENRFWFTTKVPKGQRLSGDLGYINLPSTTAVDRIYGTIAQQIIRDVDQQPTCGWVIDLQGNRGGDAWSMLAAIGPILGEGDVGWFIAPGNQKQGPWYYRNGGAAMTANPGPDEYKVDDPYQLKKPMPPVALLTDNETASAAEAVVVAFHGRPAVKTFGEPTAGVPTGNGGIKLSDGAVIILTEVLDADRNGKAYSESIPPDEPVQTGGNYLEIEQAPVVQAAVTWLHNQAACSR